MTIYIGTALIALGNGIMWPSLLSVLAKAADRDVQGAVQGLAGSVAAVASILGLPAGELPYRFMGSDDCSENTPISLTAIAAGLPGESVGTRSGHPG